MNLQDMLAATSKADMIHYITRGLTHYNLDEERQASMQDQRNQYWQELIAVFKGNVQDAIDFQRELSSLLEQAYNAGLSDASAPR